MGGERTFVGNLSAEEESLLKHYFQNPLEFSSQTEDSLRGSEGNGKDLGDLVGLDHRGSPDSFFSVVERRRKHRVYEETIQSYDSFVMQSRNLKEAKSQILSYTPGAWIEEVGGMTTCDYDVPKTTTLLLIGPRGSGKSSLVNKISRVLEDDKFASERAQVTYNSANGDARERSAVGDGSCFLRGYMVPRGSTSFCLYDTPGLLDCSSDNFKMLKSWMTKGVRHGEMAISNSYGRNARKNMKCQALQAGRNSKESRMVNFVIFVVNGLSVLNSMIYGDNLYTDMLANIFSCPYLSFKDDKPVVVVTHGDLLSLFDRARVRIHLGELLSIPPLKQVFDIPEKCDPATELAIVDMLRHSLEHADRNLPRKHLTLYKVRSFLLHPPRFTIVDTLRYSHKDADSSSLPCKYRALKKVFAALKWICVVCIFLLFLAILHRSKINRRHRRAQIDEQITIDWHSIRHLWMG